MKLSIVTETYPPEINGVAMTLGRIVRELRRIGWKVSLHRPFRSDRVDLHHDDIDHQGFPIPGYPQLCFGTPAPLKLRRLWKLNRPDLVHVVTEGPLGASAVWAARSLRIPLTSSFHTNFHSYSAHYGFGPLRSVMLAWLRFLHNRTLRTFAPTRSLCVQLATEGFQDLAVLSRGVDTLQFSPSLRSDMLRSAWSFPSDSIIALHVGRVAAEKGIDLLMRAYSAMRVAEPKVRLVMVGDGPLRAPLEARHPEVHFTGFVSRETLGTHYASADIFLFPSRTETFGNVLTEALASGLPSVSLDYAASREFVRDGFNGLQAPYSDDLGFIERAVRLSKEPDLRIRLGAKARDAVAGQSWEAVVDTFARELRTLAGKSP